MTNRQFRSDLEAKNGHLTFTLDIPHGTEAAIVLLGRKDVMLSDGHHVISDDIC